MFLMFTEAVVDYIEQVAAAAPNTPFYYYCINFVSGIYRKLHTYLLTNLLTYLLTALLVIDN